VASGDNADHTTEFDLSLHMTDAGATYVAIARDYFGSFSLCESVKSNEIVWSESGGDDGGDIGGGKHYYYDDVDLRWYEADSFDETFHSTGYCPNCGAKLSENAIDVFDANCPVCNVAISYNNGTITLRGGTSGGDDTGGGSTSGEWLFENERITTEWRHDIPFTEAGKSYTCFVDGEEICTVTAGEYSTEFINQDKGVYLYCSTDSEYWCFDTTDSWATVASGDVSIRINKTSGGTDARYTITFPTEFMEEYPPGVAGANAKLRVELAEGVSVDGDIVSASLYGRDGEYIGTQEISISTGGTVEVDFEGFNGEGVAANGYHSVVVSFSIGGEGISETHGCEFP
jgi:hypothetical protein